jgi:hypothetical protein
MIISHRPLKRLLLCGAIAVSMLPANAAFAVSERVKSACSSDYHRFCPSHAVGSSSLRACMRQVGKRLSSSCIDALVDAGEIKRSSKKR